MSYKISATRQFIHSYGKGFVLGYDVDIIDKEIAKLKKLSDSSYNVCQDALIRVKALELELADSIPRINVEGLITNYINFVKSRKPGEFIDAACIIETIRQILSNQTRPGES